MKTFCLAALVGTTAAAANLAGHAPAGSTVCFRTACVVTAAGHTEVHDWHTKEAYGDHHYCVSDLATKTCTCYCGSAAVMGGTSTLMHDANGVKKVINIRADTNENSNDNSAAWTHAPTAAPTAAPTPAPTVAPWAPLTWARPSGAKMTCSGGKTTSALMSSPGGTISVTGGGWAPGCYTTKTIPFATSNWQGVQFRLASTAGYVLVGFGNSNYRMHSGSGLKYGLFTVEIFSGGSAMNVYTAGNFNTGDCGCCNYNPAGCVIPAFQNGFDCDYSGKAGPMYGWSGGDTVGIMFRLANGGLEIQYRKNGVGFRTLNTVNLKTSANNPDYTSIFPLRFDTASYSGSGAAMDNIQLIVD